MKNPLLAPSLLSADFSDLSKAIKLIEDKNGKVVHIDVMDGRFVPEITYGQPVIRSIRKLTDLPFDVHLMVEHPEEQIKSFAQAGADWITFHWESTVHVHRVIQQIHELGKKAGVAIVPSTPVSAISEILEYADILLVMTVNSGIGGQELVPSCIEEVKELVLLREQKGYSFKISVDGGINNETLGLALDAGVDIFVSGSSFLNGSLNYLA